MHRAPDAPRLWSFGGARCLAAVLAVGLAFGLGTAGATAQPASFSDGWRWATYTTDQGLPANYVGALVEAVDGTLWANTEAGLAWYDGFRWHVRTGRWHGPIVAASGGGLYGIANQQLARITRSGVERFDVLFEGEPLKPRTLVALDDGSLLVTANRGLFQIRDGRAAPLALPDEVAGYVPDGSGLYRTRSGAVWLLAPQGFFRRTEAGWEPWGPGGIKAIREDALGGVVAVEKEGAQGLWAWAPGERPRRLAEVTTEPLVQAMDLSPTGDGLVIYVNGRVRRRVQGRWTWLDAVPPPLIHPHFVHYQSNGDLWVGSDRGLLRFRATAQRWTSWHDGRAGGHDHVNAILPAHDGSLWLGTSHGLDILRPDGTRQHLDAVGDSLLGGVTALAQSPDGAIWVGSGSSFRGAFRFDGRAWRHVGADDGLPPFLIHRIVPDRQGRLWFLGLAPGYARPDRTEPGAYVYDGETFEGWTEARGLRSGRVYDFAQGPDGALWFATLRGISRFHEGRWRHWTTADGLATARVFTLAIDRGGRVWFGHQENGLGYLDAEGRPHYLRVLDGLVSNQVWDIEEGPDGALWIATRAGLSRYQDGIFASFGVNEGLERPRLWPVLPLEDRVYVGTMGGGLVSLSLAEATHPPPRVELADPLVDGGSVFVRWNAYPYEGEVDPDFIQTRMRLDDGAWSPWSASRQASVLSLAPGVHRLTVQAKNLFGRTEAGTTTTFTVPPPFYQHPAFLAGLVLLLLGIGVAGRMYWRRQRVHHALLRQREASLTEAQRIAQLGSYEIDIATGRAIWSDELYHIHGLKPGTPLGTLADVLDRFVDDEDRVAADAAMQRCLRGEGRLNVEHRIRRPDGTVRDVHVRGHLAGGGDEPLRLVGTVQDVTERKRVEAIVRRTQEELLQQKQREKERVEAELGRARDRLVRQTRLAAVGQVAASIAHELRNPLGAVRNAVYYLRRHLPPPETAGKWEDYLSLIDREVASANQIISDLLEMTRVRMPEQHALDLGAALREAFARVGAPAGVHLAVRLPEEPFCISADAGQLRQVLVNLFTNAVQAMDQRGTIFVEAHRTDDFDEVVVRDDGPGIDEAARPHIFEPLFTTKAQGTGLGLAICRQIAQRHGGTLELLPGTSGAAFRMRLPRPAPSIPLN